MTIIDSLLAWKGPDKMQATIQREAEGYVVLVDGIKIESTGNNHAKALGIRQSLLLSSQEWELEW